MILEENVRVNFCDLELGNGCLDMTPKTKETKKKKKKMNQT